MLDSKEEFMNRCLRRKKAPVSYVNISYKTSQFLSKGLLLMTYKTSKNDFQTSDGFYY